jgi:hypothetical protein
MKKHELPAKGRERRAAVTFWFAVQRMVRRKSERPGPTAAEMYPPGDDGPGDDPLGTGVPRRPPDSSGSAAAAAVPDDDAVA